MFARALLDAMDAEGAPSGRDLAEAMGVREQTVSDWRAGRYRPEGAQLVRLADILAVTPEVFRRDDEVAASQGTGRPSAGDVEAQRAELHGRSIEVEALLAYALERQRLLTQALGGGGNVTATARGAAVEASSVAAARENQAGSEAAPRLPRSPGSTRPASTG